MDDYKFFSFRFLGLYQTFTSFANHRSSWNLIGKKILSSLFKRDGSRTLYKVKIQKSSIYGSGLSDINVGVLLCIINENGDSILKRIPTSSMKDHPSTSEESIFFHKHFISKEVLSMSSHSKGLNWEK